MFAALAVLPLLVLGLLALAGARAHVGVVTTGVGEHLTLGAAWVAVWLTCVIVSPIAAVAAMVSAVWIRALDLASSPGRVE